MSITNDEWNDYLDYLETLTEEQLETEIEWLKSVGIAKQRGSIVTSIQSETLQ
jgi:hypothetical protein